jgi:hypothetical protein
MIAYNLLARFEKTTGLERLPIPFARKGNQLSVEGEIEEGFQSLSDATIHDYYDYLVEERRHDERDKKDLIGLDNEQEIDVEKVSYKEE